jgi:hypothetical protein
VIGLRRERVRDRKRHEAAIAEVVLPGRWTGLQSQMGPAAEQRLEGDLAFEAR